MISTGHFQNCICQGRANPHSLCDERLTFEEKGKKVTLSTKRGEEAVAIVIDGCVCNDKQTKCDGMFLFRKNNKKCIILVELKGGDIDHAFEQLGYMKNHRQEYRKIFNYFGNNERQPIHEKAFVISNHVISRVVHHQLETMHRIRVNSILLSEATKPIPDLRKYL
jgi:hypothetical protein